MNTILLVEDDPAIANLLRLHLRAPDFAVTVCERGTAALELLTKERFAVIIFDILLPDGNGIEFCRRIRERKDWTPVLMLSALSDESDKVQALESGADDYMTKPFGVAEMMARVRALLRRRPVGVVSAGGVVPEGPVSGRGVKAEGEAVTGVSPEAEVIEVRELVIDRQKRKVTIRGQRLELTPKEFDLLWLLAGNPGKTFSRHELLEKIWGFAFQEYEHTVTSHINRLRIKIEPNLNKPEYILTTWGAGYRFAE
jgi:DNA-binding response OmpR family regulator